MREGMAVTRQSKMGLGLASHALLAERRCTGLQASLVAAGREAVVELCGIFAGKPEARSRCPLPRTGLRRRSEEQGKTRGCGYNRPNIEGKNHGKNYYRERHRNPHA